MILHLTHTDIFLDESGDLDLKSHASIRCYLMCASSSTVPCPLSSLPFMYFLACQWEYTTGLRCLSWIPGSLCCIFPFVGKTLNSAFLLLVEFMIENWLNDSFCFCSCFKRRETSKTNVFHRLFHF